MNRRTLAALLLVLGCLAFACGRKAKPEPMRGAFPIPVPEVIRCTISK
ncbi:MAG: hypothetical protein ACM319_03645 [Deltaproteobacteria bacterium]|nr:hypothetical protein [Candidatus Deferrimicrobiaceae bacterium]